LEDILVDKMSTWLHIKACALYPSYSMAFSKLNLKSQKNSNAFEPVAAFFCN
jgi:hypothetical protein